MFPSSLYTCIFSHIYNLYKIQFSSVAQSCPTLCDPMNHSTPGLPIHHELPEFTQTHWNAEVWSQETPGVTGKFAIGIRNEAGQRLIRVLPRKCTGHSKHPPTTREDSTHGHHQMVNTEIRLIIFIAAKDGEALYSQQKQDRELAVAQIMNSLLPNSDLNWRK